MGIIKRVWDPGTATRGEPHTRWHNPLTVEQRVTVHVPTRQKLVNAEGASTGESVEGNNEFVIVWQPGETREIPSIFDRVIHTVVSCGHGGDCKGVCVDAGNAGPSALLMGGSAPALIRDNMKYQVEPGLLAHLRPRTPRSMAVAPPEAPAAASPAPIAAEPGEGALARARARREAAKGRPS